MVGSVGAQEQPYAATLEITHTGVEVRRLDTLQWFSLRDGATGPIGAGDQIRTTRGGRAQISFDDGSSILLLPNTAFTLERYEPIAEGWRLWARIDGTAVVHIEAIVELELDSFNVTVFDAQGTFAMWTDRVLADVVTVADGNVLVATRDGFFSRIQAAHGLRYDADNPEVLAIDEPYNRARMISNVDARCIGEITPDSNTLVYTGAGTGYEERGAIREVADYPLLARTRSGYWTRIQYGNGFGWVITEAVDISCFLPLVPDDVPERFNERVISADRRELALLEPFFGTILDDPWFYGQG